VALPLWGAFESTYQPAHDRDVVETTQHDVRWREDLDRLAGCGVRTLRYPVRWHRIQPAPDEWDWAHTDAVLGHLRDTGMEPIVDLLHHTSYPAWVGNLASPTFGPAFVRFVEAVAERYPWLPAHTVCNEPFTTVLLCGQEGIWPPHRTGLEGFVAVASSLVPAVTRASRVLAEALPDARHVHVEAAERHTSGPGGEGRAALFDDRRWLLTDLLVGHPVDPDRPFVRELVAAGGGPLLEVEPGVVDVLGLDYYAHNQWHWTGAGGTNVAPAPPPLSDLFVEWWERYRLPTALGETNLCGTASDRASWLRYVVEQCERAVAAGVPVEGLCWFPTIDSADWASQLTLSVGQIDPVGVFWLDGDRERHPSTMSAAFTQAARGARAADLPAYRFRPPVSEWLAGWLPQMAHWPWVDPPADEIYSSRLVAGDRVGLVG
jgi:hypothetical protein